MDKMILILQSFGILLVVLGHSIKEGTVLHTYIYSFHMPLFFFISGYLLDLSSKSNINFIKFKYFLIKKIQRLLIPYFVISSIAYIPKYILNKFAVRPVEMNLKSYICGFLYPWDNSIIFFWFLPTLFFIMLFTVIFLKELSKKVKNLLIISLLFYIVSGYIKIKFLNIEGILKYTVFFSVGIFYNQNKEKIDNFFKLDKSKYIIIYNMILFINCIKYFFQWDFIIFQELKSLFISLIGILFSISLAKYICKNNIQIFKILYRKSYTIYLYSWFPQVLIRIIGIQILRIEWYYISPISFIFGVLFPVFLNVIIDYAISKKNMPKHYLSILFGL